MMQVATLKIENNIVREEEELDAVGAVPWPDLSDRSTAVL
jgi:hypothetical protein